MTKEIQLTQGKVAIVDDEWFDYLSQWKWHLYSRYAATHYLHKHTFMHRMLINAPISMEVDHVNNNPLDNRRENLRICTHAENMMNRKIQKNSISGFKGVYWNSSKEKWQAQISINNKNVYIGRFDTREEAATAYDIAAEDNYGKYANKNFGQAEA